MKGRILREFRLKWIKSRLIFGKRASPLVEEGILIGLGLFCFLLLLSAVTGLLDWFLKNMDAVIETIGGFGGLV